MQDRRRARAGRNGLRAASLPALALALALSTAIGARADGLREAPHLLGGWNGERDALARRGVDVDFSFTTEVATNLSGGDKNLVRDSSQVAAGVQADLDKLLGIRQTHLDVVMTDRFGRSVDHDADVGTNQQSQEIYGRGQTVWLTQLTLRRTLLDGRLNIAAGRDSEGNTFDLAPCNFQNLALCGPQGPNLYGNYWMSYPGSVWMARAQFDPTPTTFVGFGVYQQNPTYYDAAWERHDAWKPQGLGRVDGVVLPLEFGWTPEFEGREGRYVIGAMLNTGGQPDLSKDVDGGERGVSGLPGAQSRSSYNAWFAASQRLTGRHDGEGLIVAVRGVGGDAATSALSRQLRLTLEYQDPFHRAGNRVGMGFAATHTNPRAAAYQDAFDDRHPGASTFVGAGTQVTGELYFLWQAMRSVSLQPSLQYVMHPGGSARNADAFFVGLRSSVDF